MNHLMRNLISILTIIVIFTAPTFAYAETKDTQENYLAAKRLFEQIDSLKWHYINLPKYNEVIELAKRIVNENPDTDIAITFQYLIVQCYGKQAEYLKKFKAFRKYINMLEQVCGEAQTFLILKKEADKHYFEKDYILARQMYSLLINKFPENASLPYALYQLAEIDDFLGKTEEAIRKYKKIIRNYPQSEQAQYVRCKPRVFQ